MRMMDWDRQDSFRRRRSGAHSRILIHAVLYIDAENGKLGRLR